MQTQNSFLWLIRFTRVCLQKWCPKNSLSKQEEDLIIIFYGNWVIMKSRSLRIRKGGSLRISLILGLECFWIHYQDAFFWTHRTPVDLIPAKAATKHCLFWHTQFCAYFCIHSYPFCNLSSCDDHNIH